MASNCAVFINVRCVLSCITLAIANCAAHITTIEGLIDDGALLADSC
jgi:aerobic-type carbon monoxide dehydrogenase small subunit (CoxS/CutS family)